jgi:hypothetical protein
LVGQEVATLVNKQLEAGAHSIDFEPDNLPSGIYLYEMKTDGNLRLRRNMLFLK